MDEAKWQPIETAAPWLRKQGLLALIEKTSGVFTWGYVLLLCPKAKDKSGCHIFIGKLVDWGAEDKNTHWRDAESYEDDSLEPTHWMPLPAPPKPDLEQIECGGNAPPVYATKLSKEG